MSDELNKTPDAAPETDAPAADAEPAEEKYEGILGDYTEESTEAADTAAETEAPAPKKPVNKKALTAVGVCAAVLALGGLGTFGVLKYREVMPKTAASTNHGKVTDRMAACYVQDVVNMYKNYYGEEMLKSYYSLDLSLPLSEQQFPGAENTTWLQNVVSTVKNNVTQYLVLQEAGREIGYELSESDRKTIEELSALLVRTHPAQPVDAAQTPLCVLEETNADGTTTRVTVWRDGKDVIFSSSTDAQSYRVPGAAAEFCRLTGLPEN